MPLIFWLFDHAGLRFYGKFIFPELVIVGYIVFLLLLDERDKSQ